MSTQTNEVEDLTAKIWLLLEHFKEHLEDGSFTFPDGDIWDLKDKPSQ